MQTPRTPPRRDPSGSPRQEPTRSRNQVPSGARTQSTTMVPPEAPRSGVVRRYSAWPAPPTFAQPNVREREVEPPAGGHRQGVERGEGRPVAPLGRLEPGDQRGELTPLRGVLELLREPDGALAEAGATVPLLAPLLPDGSTDHGRECGAADHGDRELGRGHGGILPGTARHRPGRRLSPGSAPAERPARRLGPEPPPRSIQSYAPGGRYGRRRPRPLHVDRSPPPARRGPHGPLPGQTRLPARAHGDRRRLLGGHRRGGRGEDRGPLHHGSAAPPDGSEGRRDRSPGGLGRARGAHRHALPRGRAPAIPRRAEGSTGAGRAGRDAPSSRDGSPRRRALRGGSHPGGRGPARAPHGTGPRLSGGARRRVARDGSRRSSRAEQGHTPDPRGHPGPGSGSTSTPAPAPAPAPSPGPDDDGGRGGCSGA